MRETRRIPGREEELWIPRAAESQKQERKGRDGGDGDSSDSGKGGGQKVAKKGQEHTAARSAKHTTWSWSRRRT